jgi:AcrR family transcriptional regulator
MSPPSANLLVSDRNSTNTANVSNKVGKCTKNQILFDPVTETSLQPASRAQSPGRPASASRDDVLALAMRRYLRGRRIDVQAIASELGLSRTTIYRWFGSRDELIGEVLVRAAGPLLEHARAGARGTGGAALVDTLDRFNRSLADAPALRQFVENERDAALRIITSGAGRVQPWIVAKITEFITEEVRAGTYRPAIDPRTLGYAIVRLGEAFLYNDALAGMRGDVDRARGVQAALFGAERAREDEGAEAHGRRAPRSSSRSLTI